MNRLITFYTKYKKYIYIALIVLAVYFSIKYAYGLYASITINAKLDKPFTADSNLLNKYFQSPLRFHDDRIYYKGYEGIYTIGEDTIDKTIIENESAQLNCDNEYLYYTTNDVGFMYIKRYSLKDGSTKKLFRIKRWTSAGASDGVSNIFLINDVLVGSMTNFKYNPLEFDWGGGTPGHYKRRHFALLKDGSLLTYISEEKYKQLIEVIKPKIDVRPPEYDRYATGDNIFIIDDIWYYLTIHRNDDDDRKSVCYFYAWDKEKGELKSIDTWIANHPLMLSYDGKSGLYYFYGNHIYEEIKKYDIGTGEITLIGPRPR